MEPLEKIEAEELVVGKEDTIASNLTREIKGLTDACGPEVREKVKQTLVNKVIDERAALVLKALEKRDSMMREQNKLAKPDNTQIDPDGQKRIFFSPDAWKKKQEGEEKLKKMEEALEKALGDKADYEPLKKLVN